MNKRILLIADAANFWTKNIVMNLLAANGWDVVIFPIWDENDEMNRFYRENGVTVYHDATRLPVIRHIPRVRMWVRIFCNARKLKKLGPFDVVQNHFLSQRDLAIGYLIRRHNSGAKWIASFWGSDLLRASDHDLHKLRFFLKRCDHITLNAQGSLPVIRAKFPPDIASKTTVTYFGQHIYHTIDSLKAHTDQRACKKHFGMNPDSPVIALGYNASPTQQHPELLRAIGQLSDENLQNWTIVLQITYGCKDPEYFKDLREAAYVLPCKVLFLTEAMDETECAYLRIAADIFVLASTTDSFSATLREYLYAGTQALCGDWLYYPEFDTLGIETISFSSFNEVGRLLQEAVNRQILPAQLEKRLALKAMFSWETVTGEWNKLYGK